MSVSNPFDDVFKYPTVAKSNSKRVSKKQTEKLPSVVTDKKWQEIKKFRIEQKEQEEKEKDLKKEMRLNAEKIKKEIAEEKAKAAMKKKLEKEKLANKENLNKKEVAPRGKKSNEATKKDQQKSSKKNQKSVAVEVTEKRRKSRVLTKSQVPSNSMQNL